MYRFLSVPFVLAVVAAAPAGPLDEMSLERWAKLREVERYQLNIAERFYKEQQWKVAADEYEKYLKLYEKSVGAPYAQLKWSLCQVKLRNLNTAIKDGFQTVIDYFPDSPEAVSSALLIGKTYKDMGDLRAAKKAHEKLLKSHPQHYVAVLARTELVEIAEKEKDDKRCVALLRELTYDVDRKGASAAECVNAGWKLARHYFHEGDFAEGLKAMEKSCSEAHIPEYFFHAHLGNLHTAVQTLTGSTDADVKKKGDKLADDAVTWLKNQAMGALRDEKRKAWAVSTWYRAADIQSYARRPDKEREVYEQMLSTLGENDAVLGRLAGWYGAHKQYDKARATYGRYKDPIAGQSEIASTCRDERTPAKIAQAIDIYMKLSVQDDKNRPKWMMAVAYTHRHYSGAPDKAIAVYRDLIVSDVKSAPTYQWEIAETLYQAHRWAEAIVVYRGTENFPTNYTRMAYCNRQLKKYDEAITLYRQVMAGHEASASWALLEIGRTYEEAARKEDAIKTFKLVCDRFPKSGEGSWAHSHLNEKYKITVTLGGAKE